MLILLVDDEPLTRMGVGMVLEELGHEVIKASLGTQALQILQDNPNVELLMTDFRMPGLTGLQLIEKARELRPELKAVLMTGYSSTDYEFPEDCPTRLAKPFGERELSQTLAAV
jgi:YesN/AraC family two-component response regulator